MKEAVEAAATAFARVRIGDVGALRLLTDAALPDLADGSLAALHHRQGYLRVKPLNRVHALLKTPGVGGVLSRIIAAVGSAPAAD